MEQIVHFGFDKKWTESDHYPITFKLRMQLGKIDKREKKADETMFYYKWDASHKYYYKDSLRNHSSVEAYQSLLCKIADTSTNCDSVFDSFYALVNGAIEGNFRKCRTNIRSSFPRNVWYDDECKLLKSRLRVLQNRDPNGANSSDIAKQYKNTVRCRKRKHFRDVAQQLDYLESHDPCQYWKFWKKHRKHAHATFNITADTFSAYYKDNANPAYNERFDYAFMEKLEEVINSRGIDIHYNTNEIQHEIMNTPITQAELYHAIRKSKVGKACGSDAIPVEFYKHGEEMLHKAILTLFNFVFHNSAYPQIWSVGIIYPIFKTGKMTMPENYRKITLLSSLGKLFDSILNNRSCFCKEVLQSENPWQYGFKRGTKSTDNLFILNGVVENYQAQKRPVYMCFVDFKSAFDYIIRHALLFKLISQGYN